jgi:hypothetical protein
VSPVKYELGFISQKTSFFRVTAVKTSNGTGLKVAAQNTCQACPIVKWDSVSKHNSDHMSTLAILQHYQHTDTGYG